MISTTFNVLRAIDPPAPNVRVREECSYFPDRQVQHDTPAIPTGIT